MTAATALIQIEDEGVVSIEQTLPPIVQVWVRGAVNTDRMSFLTCPLGVLPSTRGNTAGVARPRREPARTLAESALSGAASNLVEMIKCIHYNQQQRQYNNNTTTAST